MEFVQHVLAGLQTGDFPASHEHRTLQHEVASRNLS